ncbi:MAG: hypothetical protein AAF380_02945, partial [Bacteroidota bacterium]
GDILCKKVDIIHIHNTVKQAINYEIDSPSISTQKAKQAFTHLKKIIVTTKKISSKKYSEELNKQMAFFIATCKNLSFADTQINEFIFPYDYFIQLDKVLSEYIDSIQREKK